MKKCYIFLLPITMKGSKKLKKFRFEGNCQTDYQVTNVFDHKHENIKTLYLIEHGSFLRDDLCQDYVHCKRIKLIQWSYLTIIRRRRGEYSPMFTEPEANNCFSMIFGGVYQGLQNNRLKYKTQTQYTYAAVVLIISLHVHRLPWINLLIEFGRKTNERNTTKNKFIRYLCFIVVDCIHSCHHLPGSGLKMSIFSLKENKCRYFFPKRAR